MEHAIWCEITLYHGGAGALERETGYRNHLIGPPGALPGAA